MSAPPHTPSQRPHQSRLEKRDRGELARGGAMVFLAAIAIAFALLNLKDVRVDWILGSGRAPLIVVIVISMLIGVVFTYFAERVSRRRRR
jgi:uncharacterized integral membrane protein